jgi:hypothetical protein
MMGTQGFANPRALWLRPAKPAFAYAMMGTQGFANPRALWLRPAKPAFAYAMMGILGSLALGTRLHPATPALRAASPKPRAFWLRRAKPG